jgi:hypothetical protein
MSFQGINRKGQTITYEKRYQHTRSVSMLLARRLQCGRAQGPLHGVGEDGRGSCAGEPALRSEPIPEGRATRPGSGPAAVSRPRWSRDRPLLHGRRDPLERSGRISTSLLSSAPLRPPDRTTRRPLRARLRPPPPESARDGLSLGRAAFAGTARSPWCRIKRSLITLCLSALRSASGSPGCAPLFPVRAPDLAREPIGCHPLMRVRSHRRLAEGCRQGVRRTDRGNHVPTWMCEPKRCRPRLATRSRT